MIPFAPRVPFVGSTFLPVMGSLVIHASLFAAIVAVSTWVPAATDLGNINLSGDKRGGSGDRVTWVSLATQEEDSQNYEQSHTNEVSEQGERADDDTSTSVASLMDHFGVAPTLMSQANVEKSVSSHTHNYPQETSQKKVSSAPLKKRVVKAKTEKVTSPAPLPSTLSPLKQTDVSAPKGEVGSTEGKSNQLSTTSGGGDQITDVSAQGDGTGYTQTLGKWLARHTFYPPQAKMMELQGVVAIRVTILRDGTVDSHNIVKSSGEDILDKAAEIMVNKASPFPAVPETILGTKIAFTVPVRFLLS